MNSLKALLFGITIACAVGPIALLIVNNGLRHGAGAGVRSAFGASLADAVYGLAALVVGQQVAVFLSAHQAAFALASSLVLAAFGLWMVRGAVATSDADCCREAKARGTGVRGTFLLTIVNPLTIVSFLGFTGQLRLSGQWFEPPVLALAIALGSFLVGAGFAVFAGLMSRWLHQPRIVRGLNVASGLAIAVFGLYGAVPAMTAWLS